MAKQNICSQTTSETAKFSSFSHKKVTFPAVAYAEIFHGGFVQEGRMVVICIWCALFVTSQFGVIVIFPNQRFCGFCWHSMHNFLHPLPYFMCHCTEYKLLAFQVRVSEENKLNATTQEYIIAKISGCALRQGSKTHSSLLQRNLQLQNQAALMSCRIWAVKHRCAAGLISAHPGLKGRILLNYIRIENAHKVRKKTFDFLLFIEVQQSFSFPFSLLRHYQMPECFYVINCCFWARATVHATEIGNETSGVSACTDQQGRIQSVSLGGAISVIFGSQASVGSQVSFRIVQNHVEKSYFCRF